MERCFGVWKRRFPILSKGIRVCQDTAMAIIVACAVLHNMCRFQNDDLAEDDTPTEQDDVCFTITDVDSYSLINNYFAKL